MNRHLNKSQSDILPFGISTWRSPHINSNHPDMISNSLALWHCNSRRSNRTTRRSLFPMYHKSRLDTRPRRSTQKYSQSKQTPLYRTLASDHPIHIAHQPKYATRNSQYIRYSNPQRILNRCCRKSCTRG